MKKLALALISFLTGGLGLTKALVVEVVAAIFKRIAWKVVLERFLTRVLVACLLRLKGLTSNQIYQGTVDSIIKQLSEGGLTQAVLPRPNDVSPGQTSDSEKTGLKTSKKNE